MARRKAGCMICGILAQLCYSKMARHSSRFRSGWGITAMWSQRTHTVMFWQNPSVKWPIRCQNFWAKSRPFDRLKKRVQKPFDRHLTDIKNLEILKAAKSYEKSSFSSEKLLFRWQPKKDSNPHKQSQSLSCYLYTIRLYSLFVLATCILYYGIRLVSRAFFIKVYFFKEGRSTCCRLTASPAFDASCPYKSDARVLPALKRQLVGGDFVLFGDRANGAARYTRCNDARRNIAGDHAASPDDRAFPNGDAAADYRVGTDPYVVLQADGFGGVDTV